MVISLHDTFVSEKSVFLRRGSAENHVEKFRMQQIHLTFNERMKNWVENNPKASTSTVQLRNSIDWLQ